MTTRYIGYVVAIEEDIREDDAEPILNAIKQIRGVISVRGLVDESPLVASDFVHRQRAISALYKTLKKLEEE